MKRRRWGAAFLASRLRSHSIEFAAACCSYRIMITLNPKPLTKLFVIRTLFLGPKFEDFHCKIHYSGCTAVILDTNLVCSASDCDFRAVRPPRGCFERLRRAAPSDAFPYGCSRGGFRCTEHLTRNRCNLLRSGPNHQPLSPRGSPTTPASRMLSKSRYASPPLIGGYGG